MYSTQTEVGNIWECRRIGPRLQDMNTFVKAENEQDSFVRGQVTIPPFLAAMSSNA